MVIQIPDGYAAAENCLWRKYKKTTNQGSIWQITGKKHK